MAGSPGSLVIRTLRDGDIPGVEAVIRKAFSAGSTGRPFPPAGLVIVALLDNGVVGHVSIRPFVVSLGGLPVNCGVLHMVATDPAHQRKGIGLAMLDKVIEIMEARGMPISLLETPVPGFYEKRGWRRLGRRKVYTLDRETLEDLSGLDVGNNGRAAGGLGGRPGSVAAAGGDRGPWIELVDVGREHLPTCQVFRQNFTRRHDLVAWTNERYMERLLAVFSGGAGAGFAGSGSLVRFFQLVQVDGTARGYVLGTRDFQVKPGEPLSITVRELVAPGLDGALLARLLLFLLDFDEEFTRVKLVAPIDEPVEKFLLEAGAGCMLEENVHMIRINDYSCIGEHGIDPNDQAWWEDATPSYISDGFQDYLVDHYRTSVAGIDGDRPGIGRERTGRA